MNTPNITSPASRKGWLDFTKTSSTFFIVLIHSISTIWTNVSPDTMLWKISLFPFLFSRIPVMLFFMCSGSTMLEKERNISDIFKKYVFQILKIYVCWMLVYGAKSCISMYYEGVANLRTCFNAFLKAVLFGHYHTWFIFTLIALYLITPFLYFIVQNQKRTEYFLLLSVIFTILIPSLGTIDSFSRLSSALSDFNMTFVTGYVLYYVAGYYLSHREWNKRYTYISFLLFIICFGFACFICMHQSVQTGTATFEVFGNFSPLAFLSTIFLFGTIRGLEHISFPPIFSKLTVYGFGIYLMHPLFIEYIQPVTNYTIFLVIPLFYLFCLFICWFINKNKFLSALFIK